ncbi:sensor histidine kinase [Agrobacterium rosae]|uniref:histidine kinase n=1 Tax=Agrobacterium rosae TaxID=1972867 RepID=A0ABU4W566_9HYPH|nr:sensor histidine kinase [Agrobacterium rosae]MDX8332918.1 sensor histidine kinase [Agrobacterium rosae]
MLKEVNHRVQNSLQLVSAFLRLQARSANDSQSKLHLDEAQKRLTAVALVHRRLYQDESIEVIDLSRYLEDLCHEMKSSMDADWAEHIEVSLAPILVATERAVNIGLILTELIINANKYAYGGKPGPLAIDLEQHRTSLPDCLGQRHWQIGRIIRRPWFWLKDAVSDRRPPRRPCR